jgi:hypothetical protein
MEIFKHSHEIILQYVPEMLIKNKRKPIRARGSIWVVVKNSLFDLLLIKRSF